MSGRADIVINLLMKADERLCEVKQSALNRFKLVLLVIGGISTALTTEALDTPRLRPETHTQGRCDNKLSLRGFARAAAVQDDDIKACSIRHLLLVSHIIPPEFDKFPGCCAKQL